MYQKSVLSNGLRVVTSFMPHIHSVCISIFIGAGSRYENREQSGVSHFIEHLCFKGTERRPTSRDISAAIDGVGGVLNGGTDKELTVYWCKVAHSQFPLAVDVLADIVRHSKFAPQDIEAERRVIIEELNMQLDSPQQRADMLINELLWPDHPLGWEIGGSKETVAGISRQMMLDYLRHQYSPDNTVISIAGGISQEEALAQIEAALGDWSSAEPAISYRPASNTQDAPRLSIESRDTEQVHLCLAVPGLSATHPDRFTLDLLNAILGGGMSSRLFIEIRDKRSLAYAIHSYAEHFSDSGSVTIYAGVNPSNTETAIEAILEEVRGVTRKIPESEITRAKELIKGRLLLRMEDSSSVAHWMGGQELLQGHILTIDDVGNAIDAVTTEDLQRVSRELLITEKLNLSLVGPAGDDKRLQKLLRLQ